MDSWLYICVASISDITNTAVAQQRIIFQHQITMKHIGKNVTGSVGEEKSQVNEIKYMQTPMCSYVNFRHILNAVKFK
jgi:hypothetical protein